MVYDTQWLNASVNATIADKDQLPDNVEQKEKHTLQIASVMEAHCRQWLGENSPVAVGQSAVTFQAL